MPTDKLCGMRSRPWLVAALLLALAGPAGLAAPAAARPVDSEDIFRLTLLSGARIAPDGAHAAVVASRMDGPRNAYDRTILVVDTASGATRDATRGRADGDIAWAPDGKSFAFARAAGGAPARSTATRWPTAESRSSRTARRRPRSRASRTTARGCSTRWSRPTRRTRPGSTSAKRASRRARRSARRTSAPSTSCTSRSTARATSTTGTRTCGRRAPTGRAPVRSPAAATPRTAHRGRPTTAPWSSPRRATPRRAWAWRTSTR